MAIFVYMKFPYFLLLLVAFVSCKSVNPSLYTLHCDSVAYTVHQTIDTIYMRDSIFIKELIRGDTVYVTHTEYRDRWRVHLVHDTVRDTQYITQTIEHPPERYIPRFYKITTILFFILLFTIIFTIFLRFRL